jgi:bisphosphoglycerate-dependent phosphoglycerate mutase
MKTFASKVATSSSTRTISKNKIAAEIWFVRHGETIGNRESILQGHCDYPLTDLGLRQCANVGNVNRMFGWLMYNSECRGISTLHNLLNI